MDHKVALFVARFIQILLRVDFENIVTHLETNRLNLGSNVFAALLHVAECLVRCAVKVWQSLLPFLSNFLKNIWWDRQLRWASVNNSWVWSVFSWFLHSFTTIIHALTFKSPSSEPVFKVLECLESFSSSYNLSRVVSSKESIWSLAHFPGCDTKTDHCTIDDLIIFKWPEIMELLLFHVLMWGQTKNTIRIMTKSLRFIKCQELEESTFVVFQVNFKLIWSGFLLTLQRLDASVVLPYESL